MRSRMRRHITHPVLLLQFNAKQTVPSRSTQGHGVIICVLQRLCNMGAVLLRQRGDLQGDTGREFERNLGALDLNGDMCQGTRCVLHSRHPPSDSSTCCY
jgi:hypothetical protein